MKQEPQENRVSPTPRSLARWLLLGTILLLAAVLVVKWAATSSPTGQQPLTGELIIYVRPPGAKQDTYEIGEAGALPVRSGQSMSLEVHYNLPAHTYLVWFSPQGSAVPLYPWNMETIETRTITSPPPQTLKARFVMSPMMFGAGWPFGKESGLETVLLLARREPLGQGVNLSDLLARCPAGKLRHREEASALAWDRGDQRITETLALNRGPEDEVKTVDGPFLAFLKELQPHFDLIRAVRFAHDGEK